MNDLLRLAVAERSKVTSTITLSYANFVYQTGGVFAIVLIVFVQVIIWFTSLLKPIVMIVFLGLLIYSFIFKRMMKHESNQSLQGYLVSMALMCLVNGIYALLLKLMLMGPELGFNTFSCIVFILFVQILYVIVLLSIMRVVLQNHTDIGMYGYRSAYDKHFARRIDATRMRVSEVTSGRFGFSSRRPTRSKYSRYTSTRGLTGDDIVRDMRYKEELRRDRAYGRTSRRQRYDQYVDSDR